VAGKRRVSPFINTDGNFSREKVLMIKERTTNYGILMKSISEK